MKIFTKQYLLLYAAITSSLSLLSMEIESSHSIEKKPKKLTEYYFYEKIKAGANPDTGFGSTNPLVWASLHKKIDLVRFLLEHGANPNQESAVFLLIHKLKNTQKKFQILALFDLFRKKQHNKKLSMFIDNIITRKKEIPSFNDLDNSYLNDNGIIVYLIHKGVNPNIIGNCNPLVKAIENKNYNLVVFLLNHNANPDKAYLKAKTPLLLAVELLSNKDQITNILHKKSMEQEGYATESRIKNIEEDDAI